MGNRHHLQASMALPSEMRPGDSSTITAQCFAACGLPAGELRLSGVLGIEEQLTSTVYGLKGTLDGIVSAQLSDGRGGMIGLPMPLELKTGKRTNYNIADHNAQV